MKYRVQYVEVIDYNGQLLGHYGDRALAVQAAKAKLRRIKLPLPRIPKIECPWRTLVLGGIPPGWQGRVDMRLVDEVIEDLGDKVRRSATVEYRIILPPGGSLAPPAQADTWMTLPRPPGFPGPWKTDKTIFLYDHSIEMDGAPKVTSLEA